ncbi:MULTISPECIES: tyrosine recombinase XerC [Finegoldia]|uniref:tyrosine recombinase XerC n=1 Tax=Finegoldia TaxID=150022 RepID=UPI0012B0FFFB|nr:MULTISPECIES: tyrosine recombinase XerC [Finegoldia]MBS5965892.1 tyrosine recombinase XerC [Finegoldia magna]MDU4277108.1 tyrosine recombinase XerC [Finegoldia magna]MDU5069588.1 tyrosine recombinase XerC [Finegoldia magna]MSB10639.1 tyrosine-type recombinase/integrase [Finegoldia sp. BIOML-A1]
MNSYPMILMDFLDYLETIKGRSSNTVKEYAYDINLMIKYILARKQNIKLKSFDDIVKIDSSDVDLNFFKNIDVIDLHSFMGFLDHNRSNGSSTRSRKTSSIRTFYKYLINIRKLDIINPAELLDSPKKNIRQPVYLTLDESLNLLKVILREKDEEIKARDYCITVLFLNCGMRLSELSSINIDHIKTNTLRVIGKGNKERTVYLNDMCLDALDNYLKIRPEIDNDALFISKKRNRMSNRAIQYRIEHYLKAGGFDTSIYSVHKLRHTAATLMYQYGNVDIKVLQEILGHESVSTTQIYTHVDNNSLRSAVNKNPLNTLNNDLKNNN